MVRLGIKNPTISRSRLAKEGVTGVALYNLDDIKRFTTSVHPINQEKAAKLNQIHDRESQRGKSPWYTDEQIVENWVKARELLGHSPTASELRRLRREGVIQCSVTVYVNRFGSGNFQQAKENLDKIAGEKI